MKNNDRWSALYASFVPLADYTGSGLEEALRSGSAPTDFAQIVNLAFRVAIVTGTVLAVLQIVRAGFMYMTSEAGSSKSHAKDILKNALKGLLLLLATYIILYQINPDILNVKAVLPSTPMQNGLPVNNSGSNLQPVQNAPVETDAFGLPLQQGDQPIFIP